MRLPPPPSLPLLRSIAFFLGLWCVLLVTASGHQYGNDGAAYYRIAESLVFRGWMDVPPPSIDPNMGGGVVGPDGLYYMPFQVGFPLYLVPWFWVGLRAEPLLGVVYAPSMLVSLANTLSTALMWSLWASLLFGWGFSQRAAFGLSLVGLASSFALPYARYDYSEPLLGLCVVVAVWGLERARSGSRGALPLVVLAVFWGLLIRAPAAVLAPPLACLTPGVWPSRLRERLFPGSTRTLSQDLPGFLAILSGGALGVASVLLQNYLRFGTLSESGYGLLPDGSPRWFSMPAWYGLAVHFVAPGKALWVFAPLLLLAPWGWRRLRQSLPEVSACAMGMVLAQLALYATWHSPEGGYTWGPRFFVPLVPFLLLPAMVVWREAEAGSTLRRAFVGLAVLGVAVNLLGMSVNFASVVKQYDQGRGIPFSERYYHPMKARYNLRFVPFDKHLRLLGKHLRAEGPLWALREERQRVFTEGVYLVNTPLWDDCPDIWVLHLLKDGYPRGRVLGLFTAGLLAGLLGLAWAICGRREE